MKKITVIIQARLGSTRLPNKVLADIEGKSMLWHLINRLKHSKYNPELVIATTTSENDKKIIDLSKNLGLKSLAGSEDDVLDRYYQAALKNNAETIVRITADCPMIDPVVMDKVIEKFFEENSDYASNTHPPTYPDGLDVEVFSFKTLKKAWNEAKRSTEREHVTYFIYTHPELFKLSNVVNPIDLNELRWTVDEKEDLDFVREIYKNLYYKREIFLMEDILKLLREKPELIDMNKKFMRDEGLLKSLKEDRIIK